MSNDEITPSIRKLLQDAKNLPLEHKVGPVDPSLARRQLALYRNMLEPHMAAQRDAELSNHLGEEITRRVKENHARMMIPETPMSFKLKEEAMAADVRLKKVRLSENYSQEDLIDMGPDLLSVVKDLTEKLLILYPNAVKMVAERSDPFDDMSITFCIKGLVPVSGPPCVDCNGLVWDDKREKFTRATRETVGMVCQTCGTDYSEKRD